MSRVATIALAPLSLVYRAVVALRSALYQKGIFKTHKVPVPVISIGNITTGGTGKTPLVEWIAHHLAERGYRVCILTRGYGRANPGERVLVSDGAILADVDKSGDEALMLAQNLTGKSAVVCDADRVAGARWVIEKLSPHVLILDDGFQHQRLARDLEIVVVDASNPWSNGWLLPAGRLREPVASLRRADCVVVTRIQSDNGLERQIKQKTGAVILTSKTVIRQTSRLVSPEVPVDKGTILNQPIAAFCGIGNPNAFFQQLREEGFELRVTQAFRDHHEYSQTDIDLITQKAIEAGASALITTAKDAVKLRSLRFALPCYVAEIEIEISEPDKLLALIETAIEPRRSAR